MSVLLKFMQTNALLSIQSTAVLQNATRWAIHFSLFFYSHFVRIFNKNRGYDTWCWTISLCLCLQRRSFARRLTIADIEKKLGFPEKPKRPRSPFIHFASALRPTLKDVGSRKFTDLACELGALWKNTNDAQKAIYKQEYEKDRVICISTLKFVMTFS